MTSRFLLLMATLTAFGCGEGMIVEEEATEVGHNGMTWEEFNSVIYLEPGSDVYIVNGDETIVGEKNLREFYENHIANGQGALIVNRVSSADDKWNSTQQKNITYCVNKTAFGSRYAQVMQAMTEAASAWQNVADVRFVHVAAQDASCTSSNSQVVFDVNPVNVNGQYIARAFFPAQGRSSRNVLIDNTAFTSSGSPSLTAVLRHELGHTLGFRHEHTRPEAGTCFEDSRWRPLTDYDSASVMHYPQCNGTGGWTLQLTAKDAQGAQALYGAPVSSSEPPAPTEPEPTTPAAGTTSETVNATVAKGGSKSFGPYAVVPGTVFSVVMSGSGDPDLYVRFGAAPTSSAWDCRPYTDGAAETCSINVPAGKTTAYLMVNGYTASTFQLAIAYTKATTTAPSTPVNPIGTAKASAIDGSVAAGGEASYGPITVLAGTTFKVVMSGSGDPDLYVRFGAAPTVSTYNCRPYLDGAAETCTLTVPEGQSQAYVMVKGYTASTYHLDINYTEP
ncbi:MAG: matrixin family metalloprotease [Deltaproteobacteria bacterium]|nr:matrixin family metalloprotease [Deltaproteobacteria bacterium]